MALAPGTRLGPYEIQVPLGAGGMGEVYRAKDTRLDRTVAIKVLPSQFSADADRRQRFEREARAVSSLNHPHICTLHDVGEQNGTVFLVMEHLEGQTLAERLEKGPLPTDQMLRYGTEIADSLDKAHRQGIVHRDLKPGNIMLTKSGAKLLDFGLAKRSWQGGAPADVSKLATREKPLTGEGTLLGTFQYMAPEQLEGREADARTDIFALGSLLHEMATGQKAFSGRSQASLISAILSSEPPPISTLQPLSPPALDHLVRTCLAKDPDDRWQMAHDVMAELKWIAQASSGASAAPAALVRLRVRERWAWGLVAVLAGAIGWRLGGTSAPPKRSWSAATHVALTFPMEAPLKALNRVDLALSPDSTHLVYVGGDKEKTQLYVRALNQFDVKAIPGTEFSGIQEGNPFFSPDGEWVGFFADGKLKKVGLNGGAPTVLCDAPSGRGASWGEDGVIVFAPSLSSGLSRIPAVGGVPEVLTRLDPKKGEISHRWPQVLPGGDAAIFTIGLGGSWDNARVAVVSFKTGRVKTLVEGGGFARYLPTGHLTFARGSRLMGVAFDLAKLEVAGIPVPVLDGVDTNKNFSGAAEFVFSKDGTLVYLPADLPDRSLVWVDRKGAAVPLPTPPRAYQGLALSPTGDRLALMVDDGANEDIWLYEFSSGTLTRLTFGGSNEAPIWTPDGGRITFAEVTEGGQQHIAWMPVDGSQKAERLMHSEGGWQWPRSWSPDGRTLLFNFAHPITGYDIWMFSRNSTAEQQPFVQTPYDERNPVFSPDGASVAYQSNETGEEEIYVMPYPSARGKRQVSSHGGREPVWSPNGSELFFREGDGGRRVMAVNIETKPTLKTSQPRFLFEGHFQNLADFPSYAISRDSLRFLLIKRSERDETLQHVNVVFGWFDELARRVSTKR
jgi:Tol biopolymer transport system component